MCQFFSFCTDPTKAGDSKYLYFEKDIRKKIIQKELKDTAGNLYDSTDSHTSIADYFGYTGAKEDGLNRYEYNPLTQKFEVDNIGHTKIDDSKAAEAWVRQLDFKTVCPELIIKPIVNPLEIPPPEITDEHKELLRQWAQVGDQVWDQVGAQVRDQVGAQVGAQVRAQVRDQVGTQVWAHVWAYISSFFDIQYAYDFSSAVKLWEAGFVASYDGTTWRLHAGKDAKIVYEWNKGE